MRLAWLVMVTACWSAPPAPTPVPSAPAKETQDPRAYILGKGVKRDYRVAARLYARRCGDGCSGDLESCRAYLELAMQARGTVATQEHFVLAAQLCDRGEYVPCLIAGLVGLRVSPTLDSHQEVVARCEGGNIRACRSVIETELGPSDSSSHEWTMRGYAEKVCASGIVSGCTMVLEHQWSQCAHAAARGDACIEWQAAQWKSSGIDATSLRDAWRRVTAACSDGDADACEHVPGREIPDRERCDAGDFQVCERLAQAGDRHAASVACAGGLGKQCTPPRPEPASPVSHGEQTSALHKACVEEHDEELCKQLKLELVPPCPRW